jgi:hypothetical protein
VQASGGKESADARQVAGQEPVYKDLLPWRIELYPGANVEQRKDIRRLGQCRSASKRAANAVDRLPGKIGIGEMPLQEAVEPTHLVAIESSERWHHVVLAGRVVGPFEPGQLFERVAHRGQKLLLEPLRVARGGGARFRQRLILGLLVNLALGIAAVSPGRMHSLPQLPKAQDSDRHLPALPGEVARLGQIFALETLQQRLHLGPLDSAVEGQAREHEPHVNARCPVHLGAHRRFNQRRGIAVEGGEQDRRKGPACVDTEEPLDLIVRKGSHHPDQWPVKRGPACRGQRMHAEEREVGLGRQ